MSDPFDILGTNVPIAEVGRFYADNRLLHVDVGRTTVGPRVHSAIERDIPPDVLGDYSHASVILKVGEHDLWEDTQLEDGRLIARAKLSVTFVGYGSVDFKRFREKVFIVPELQAVTEDLEIIVGTPLERCVIWSV